MDRRNFITHTVSATGLMALGAVAQTQTPAAPAAAAGEKILILGISASSRPGKTTATAIQVALEAAQKVNPRIETKLIDLGGMTISGYQGGAKPNEMAEIVDDFSLKVYPALLSYNLGGLIIGSPTYFRTMSAQCKAFLERLAVLRSPTLKLADLPVGALSVGAYRNGGQELVIDQILMAMLCHEVLAVGGKPSAHQGATLWNNYADDIMKDEFGIVSARKLGERVAELAVKLKS